LLALSDNNSCLNGYFKGLYLFALVANKYILSTIAHFARKIGARAAKSSKLAPALLKQGRF
jgi:hypothetical protein